MTETTPGGDAAAADVTARVLAAAKQLRDGFEGHYAAVAGKVKKEIEGPVRIIDTGDDIPVVMQLSAWDTRMGPVPAMLVGGGAFLARITPQEQDYTTRMMDMLEPGSTCDLSKDGLNRLLLKCAVHGSNVRGGEAWLLLAAYYDPRIAVPKQVVEELLVELAGSVEARPAMAAEALAMRERYDPATSTWRPLLQELRLSIWALVQKSAELPPAGIPGLDPAEAKRLLDEEVVPNIRRARGGGVGGSDAPKPARKKPSKEAVKAWFMSAYGKLRLEERLKHAAPAVPSKAQGQARARKAIAVPPVEAVVAPQAPAPEIALPAVPGVAPGFPAAPPRPPPAHGPASTVLARSPVESDTTLEKTDTALKQGDAAGILPGDPLASIESSAGTEPVPVPITINKPLPGGHVTPRQPSDSPVAPKKLAAIEAPLIEVLGKLQRSGYSLKVDKETGEATACKLVELDPGKGGLLALFLTFKAGFLAHPVLHEIDGRFFAGDERVITTPYRPPMRNAIAAHLKGARDIVYRGKSIGKVYKDRPLKPVIVPLVLVRSAIKGTGTGVPFKWVEPCPADGVEHGHLVVAAPDIDRAEAFVMNCVRVLGPRMVASETAHVEATEGDITRTSRSGQLLAAATAALAAAGLLASAHMLPAGATVAILQYWYVLAGALVVLLVSVLNLYQKLDARVQRALDARLQDVTPRTPLLARPPWEILIDAARRVGKADFDEFKAAFCQELDPVAVDEAVEVVWQQDAPKVTPEPKASVAALGELARAAARPKARVPIVDHGEGASEAPKPYTGPGTVLRVTETGLPRRKKRADDDILNETDDGETESPATEPTGAAVEIDWSAALKGK